MGARCPLPRAVARGRDQADELAGLLAGVAELVLLVGREISNLDRLLRLVTTALGWSVGLLIALSILGGLFRLSGGSLTSRARAQGWPARAVRQGILYYLT